MMSIRHCYTVDISFITKQFANSDIMLSKVEILAVCFPMTWKYARQELKGYKKAGAVGDTMYI